MWSRHAGALLAAPILALALLIGASQVALAHAEPISSTPSPNQNLTTAPTIVTITFGQHVKPEGSNIAVYDTDGKQVSTGPATADASDLTKMSVAMQGDDSEAYLVVWHTVSVDDGESAIGSFTFGVNATADDLPDASGGSGGSSSPGVTPLVATLIGLAGVALGAAGGVLLARRQRAAP